MPSHNGYNTCYYKQHAASSRQAKPQHLEGYSTDTKTCVVDSPTQDHQVHTAWAPNAPQAKYSQWLFDDSTRATIDSQGPETAKTAPK